MFLHVTVEQLETGQHVITLRTLLHGTHRSAPFHLTHHTTRLLSEYVPDPLTLEQAVYRLTGMPATIHGLRDRGTLRVGAKADIVCFDPEKLSAGKADAKSVREMILEKLG